MYRIEDIKKIEENIDNIKEGAAKQYKTFYEPTLEETSNVYKAIRNFISRKKKIVYGGFAQNLLVKTKNPKDVFYQEIDGAFYNWPDLADIEFYTPTPLNDIIELTEELHASGFKHVEGKEGMHPETYKIFVNFINYCDFTYLPTNIYNNLPYIEIDGIRCCHPHFMMIDAYRILTDPMTSYWRLEKPLKRFQLVLHHYPIDQSKNNNKISFSNKFPDVLRTIRKKIIHKTKLIMVGFGAYNYYANKVDKKYLMDKILFFEFIVTIFINIPKKI